MAQCGTLAALTLSASPALSQGFGPVSVTDILDREVTLYRRPERIVPLFSSNTEIAAALGASDRIIAIDGQTYYPRELMDRPKIGSRVGFSADIIARLNADFVIMTPARQAPNQLIRPLTSAGIPVMVINHRTLKEILTNIALVGKCIGSERGARDVISGIEREISGVQSLISGARVRRVYMETGSGGRGS